VTTNRKAKGWAGAGAGEAAHPKEETMKGFSGQKYHRSLFLPLITNDHPLSWMIMDDHAVSLVKGHYHG